MNLFTIIEYLNTQIPPLYKEDYDNIGLLTGNASDELKGILVSLDVTEDVVNEAISQNCNLIIAHHPIIFKGLKKITGNSYIEKSVIKAIKNDIAIYASHTNLDNVKNGVSFKMAQKLNLQNIRILSPKKGTLKKLVVFVPIADTDKLADALYKAGAGNIGNYHDCSFRIEGTGTFKPNEKAKPYIGEAHQQERVQENRIELLFPADAEQKVLKAMYQTHPYEEVAYYLSSIENENQEIGSGIIGELPVEMRSDYFLEKVKATYRVKTVRHSKLTKDTVKTIAMCGGAGSFLLHDAIRQKADVLVTADFKYHEFFDAEDKTIIADIGHYESEQFTKELLSEIILNKFPNIALLLSKTNTNPVYYT